jgi:hypothetical protein
MKRINNTLLVALIAFSVCTVSTAIAQESYLLKDLRIPHAAQENPGVVIPFDAHIGFPGINKIQVGGNLPFNYGDIMNISDNFLKSIHKNNAVRAWVEVDPIHFGFRTHKRNYFSITTAVKADVYTSFKEDLASFLIKGNAPSEGKTLSLIGKDFISAIAYFEVGLGYNREINDNISVGINVKYLSGLANAYTSNASLTLYTSDKKYDELILNHTLQGKFASVVDIGDSSNTSPFSEIGSNLKNHGFAFDLGFRYRINSLVEVSAAALDIGFIKWKTYTQQYDIKDKEFSFTGLHHEDVFDDSLAVKGTTTYFEQMRDSISDNFIANLEKSGSYTKWLNFRFNVGGAIYASPNDRFIFTFYGKFYNGVFVPSGSISYHRTCGKWFDFIVGNTFKANVLLNPGIGVNFTLGVFQLYAMVDYTNTLAYIDKVKNFNTIVGINFIAPRKTDKIYRPSYIY